MDDGYFLPITLIHKFMSCHRCLLLSLTTSPSLPPNPSPTQPFPPQAAQANPLAALSPPFCNSSGRRPLSVVVCCMLALSSSLPLCWQPGGGGGVRCVSLHPPQPPAFLFS
ncbi:hypothetical protein F7725_015840 [Scomber scombrus]|uniref:Uncharacterized protein n=1 Tax=Scomber scombrus TaxID=13677 RepID=A0AAV1NWC9_SCOSC